MHGGVGARKTERVGGSVTRHAIALAFALAVVPTCRLASQDSTLTLPADTMHRGVRPMGAFLRSFVLPGWGQAATDRPMNSGLSELLRSNTPAASTPSVRTRPG